MEARGSGSKSGGQRVTAIRKRTISRTVTRRPSSRPQRVVLLAVEPWLVLLQMLVASTAFLEEKSYRGWELTQNQRRRRKEEEEL